VVLVKQIGVKKRRMCNALVRNLHYLGCDIGYGEDSDVVIA